MAKIILTSKSPAMKSYLPLIVFVLVFASCTTSYKTGQTPDDVYFSPERQRDEYVRVEKKDDRRYVSAEESREDRYLRMKSTYRRYSTLDDYDCYCYTGSNYYRYNDYYRNNNFYANTWWGPKWNSYNPYYYNPYYSNPYYSGYVAGNVRQVYNKPRTGNLDSYNGGSNPNANSNYSKGRSFNNSSSSSSSDNNYQGSGTGAGNFLRNTFGSSNNNSNSSSSNNNSSSSSNNSSSSSSSSSSGSTSAPVRKF